MKYQFVIAGIRIRCEIPYELNISESTVPFVSSDEADADLIFQFHGVQGLKAEDTDGIWQEDRRFQENAEGYCVYHYHLDLKNPYAKVYWCKKDPRVLHCDYVLGQEARISCTRNVINLLGLETFLQMHDGLLLHASLIRWKQKGILFTAPSGTGKSTQADLWKLHESADILNGDRAALRKDGDIWTAWGLPFAGTSGIYRNESAPITSLVVLRQAKENQIRRLTAAESIRYIYPELSIHRWDPAFVDKAVNMFVDLTASVPVYLLECLPDQGAVQLLKRTLEEGLP